MHKDTKASYFIRTMVLILTFSVSMLPVFADIAGPVVTKNTACIGPDGSSWNRLQVFFDGKKSDTLYYNKYQNQLFYTVSLFPYFHKDSIIKEVISYKEQYFAAVFLYRYDCKTKKITRLSGNLKLLVNTIYGPINGEEKASSRTKQELGYGRIEYVSGTGVTLNLFTPQVGISSNLITIPLN